MRIAAAAPVAFLLAFFALLLVLPAVDAADTGGRGSLRVGVAARAGPHSTLTPLVYWGGFQTKTACYEGLVRYGPRGEIEPGLVDRWTVSEDGRVYTLHVRPQVTFHDGRRLDAETVAEHLIRWRGNPANRWLGSTERLDDIEVVGGDTVRVTLREPWPFLEECAGAINPAFVVGKGAYDNEGTFVRTVGSGPYRLVEQEPNARYLLEAHDGWWQGRPGLARVELVVLPTGHREDLEKLEMLKSGAIDLVSDGSSPLIPREALADLGRNPSLHVWEGPGSATTLLVLNTEQGPLADRSVRRRLAAAIDRDDFVAQAELGHAVPATTLFLGGRAGWPDAGRIPAPGAASEEGPVHVVLLLFGEPTPRRTRHIQVLDRQLGRAGFEVEVVETEDRAAYYAALDAGAWSLTFRDTYGEPYDPWITLQALFHDRPQGETASSRAPIWRDDVLRRHIASAFATQDPARRREAFAAAQRRLDEEVPLIPLFVSSRVAVSRASLDDLQVGWNGYDLGLARVTCATDDAAATLQPAAAPPPEAEAAATGPLGDPTQGEVPLPAAAGWNAFLVHDNQGTGIWMIDSFQVFPRMGCPEIVGLDDAGRCHVFWSYSGKWSPMETIRDGAWLGGLAHGDVDARIPGAEVYTGGQNGNLYQVVPHRWRVLDNRLIAHIPGRAINILVAADVDSETPGPELLAFTWPGGLYRIDPTDSGTGFETRLLEDDIGRVRDAEVLPPCPGRPTEVAVVSRNGLLQILTLRDGSPHWDDVYVAEMGKGRLAVAPPRDGRPTIVYTTHDDGRILRHERRSATEWTSELIYLGPQGPRGIAAGRFDADAGVETVAIYGYSHDVELLSRAPGEAWRAQTLYRDVGKGHWLATAEVEGRNATDELVCSGYSGRVVLLARPPGYGLDVLRREDRGPGESDAR